MEFYYPANKPTPRGHSESNVIPPLSNLTKSIIPTFNAEVSSSSNSSPSFSLWPWISAPTSHQPSSNHHHHLTSSTNPTSSSSSNSSSSISNSANSPSNGGINFPVRVTLPPLPTFEPQGKRVKVQRVLNEGSPPSFNSNHHEGSLSSSPKGVSDWSPASAFSPIQQNLQQRVIKEQKTPKKIQKQQQLQSQSPVQVQHPQPIHYPKPIPASSLYLLQEGIEREQKRQREAEEVERKLEEKESEVTVIQKSQFCVPMYNSGNSVIQGPKGFIATHFKLPKKDLKCDYCQTTFKRKHLLKKHMKVHEKLAT